MLVGDGSPLVANSFVSVRVSCDHWFYGCVWEFCTCPQNWYWDTRSSIIYSLILTGGSEPWQPFTAETLMFWGLSGTVTSFNCFQITPKSTQFQQCWLVQLFPLPNHQTPPNHIWLPIPIWLTIPILTPSLVDLTPVDSALTLNYESPPQAFAEPVVITSVTDVHIDASLYTLTQITDRSPDLMD